MLYRSKIDWWVGAALLIAPIFPVVLALSRHSWWPILISIFLLVVYAVVLVPVFYETSHCELVIRAGMLRTKIHYSDIRSLRATRDPLSSPALSLDRIEICYGHGSRVLISPKDKTAFLDDLRARMPLGASVE